jgi:uncharacterized protein with HEPN domain
MDRDRAYLLDILEAAKLIQGYIGDKKKEDFLEDRQCQDAVIRRLEIIGEAARRISENTKKAFPNLPWNEMIGMRNVMIHEYNGVDIILVWDTIQRDIPPLISSLEEIISLDD